MMHVFQFWKVIFGRPCQGSLLCSFVSVTVFDFSIFISLSGQNFLCEVTSISFIMTFNCFAKCLFELESSHIVFFFSKTVFLQNVYSYSGILSHFLILQVLNNLRGIKNRKNMQCARIVLLTIFSISNFLNYVVLDDEKLAKRVWLLGTIHIR